MGVRYFKLKFIIKFTLSLKLQNNYGAQSKWFHHNLFSKTYPSLIEQNDSTLPKCCELSEYTDSAFTQVEDLSSRCINGSNTCDQCGHDTRRFHPFCTACNMMPISLHWLDRMKLVCNHTILIILPSGKNILFDTVLKMTIGYTPTLHKETPEQT